MAKILTIIAPEGYQDLEYGEPKKILEAYGHTVLTASTKQEAQGSLGGSTTVDMLLNEVDSAEFDAVIFVGGPGSKVYFNDKTALSIAKEFFVEGKLTCAICAAPVILANAGILEGKTATCFPSHKDELIDKNVNYSENPVEQDGNIITGNGPGAAKDFGKKIGKAL